MKKNFALKHQFVTTIPERLNERMLYVSLDYATAVHKCACGCGSEIVTPISPTDWKMIFDGESVSLLPSVGNWSLPCRSHYWVKHGRIEWAGDMSQNQIENIRAHGRQTKNQELKLSKGQTLSAAGNIRRHYERLVVRPLRRIFGG